METTKIGINGAGRIGRLIIRLLADYENIEISCINDLMDIETLKYLIKYDSIHQKCKYPVEIKENKILLNNKVINYEQKSKPVDIPWDKYNVDIVIDASGLFLTKTELNNHIKGNVSKVILSCPAKDKNIKTIIFEINDNQLTDEDIIISNASCTANGVAPMLKTMIDNFGIENAFMTTVHPFTNNQRIMDAPHYDPRRSRSLANNVIPTHSTAINAIHEVFPELIGKFDGVAIRVPIPSGALLELIIKTNKNISVDSINNAFLEASRGQLKTILEYSNEHIVSTDITNNPASCVFDSLMTKVLNNNYCYIASWYDNEFGYANRVIDLIKKISK